MLPKTIFFSWQSDLPSGVNRRLIENAINKVLETRKKESVHLDESVDRDTDGTMGSPDIVATVLNKIDNCSVFVADISLINLESEKKRTPNPNVMLELGYAIKTVGWDNVILVFNEAYGDISQIPFDLRQKRIFKYNLLSGHTKQSQLDGLTEKLYDILSTTLDKQVPADRIRTDVKLQVDHQIMRIGNHLWKLLYGFKPFITPHDVINLPDLETNEIDQLISTKNVLGFQVLKSWSCYADELDSIKNNVVYSKYMNDEKILALIDLSKELRIMDQNFTAIRFYEKVLVEGQPKVSSGYIIEVNQRNGILNLFKKDDDGLKSLDEGSFNREDQQSLLHEYAPVSDEVFVYILCIQGLLEAMEKVIAVWGNFILSDPATVIFS